MASSLSYVAFVDPSGGGAISSPLPWRTGSKDRAIVDMVRGMEAAV